MAKNSKIPKKLLAQMLSTVLLISVVTILFFSIKKKKETQLMNCVIQIEALANERYLISKADVKNMLDSNLGFDINSANVADLNLMELEKLLNDDERVYVAELYLQHANQLVVEIQQRKPIVRISDIHSNNYYLDLEGKRVPHVEDESVRVPVVTGYVDTYNSNYEKKKENNLNAVIAIINRLRNDDFLEPLIEQIHIEENKDIYLIPKMGRKKIILGNTEQLDEKLYNLKTYYRQGTKKVGMDKFAVLDLRFKNQVVGRT